jgi:hypothetical protein
VSLQLCFMGLQDFGLVECIFYPHFMTLISIIYAEFSDIFMDESAHSFVVILF